MVVLLGDERALGDRDAEADAEGRDEGEGDHVEDEEHEGRVVDDELQAHAEHDHELVRGDGCEE